jgi:hypothetical protein
MGADDRHPQIVAKCCQWLCQHGQLPFITSHLLRMIMFGSITISSTIVHNQRSTHDWGFIHMHGQYL